jgi:hypothetical protein
MTALAEDPAAALPPSEYRVTNHAAESQPNHPMTTTTEVKTSGGGLAASGVRGGKCFAHWRMLNPTAPAITTTRTMKAFHTYPEPTPCSGGRHCRQNGL